MNARKLSKLSLDTISEIGGSAVSVIFAGLTLNPAAGALVQPLASSIFKGLFNFAARPITPVQRVRVDAFVETALEVMKVRIAKGDMPRQGDYFAIGSDTWSKADEILESVLLAVVDSYEQRKVPLLGRLYANLAFREDIDPQYAHYLVSLANELTYTQLLALAIGRQPSLKSRLRDHDYTALAAKGEMPSTSARGLLSQILMLEQRGFLAADNTSAWLGVTNVVPGGYKAETAGFELTELMNLLSIPESEFSDFFDQLGPTVDA